MVVKEVSDPMTLNLKTAAWKQWLRDAPVREFRRRTMHLSQSIHPDVPDADVKVLVCGSSPLCVQTFEDRTGRKTPPEWAIVHLASGFIIVGGLHTCPEAKAVLSRLIETGLDFSFTAEEAVRSDLIVKFKLEPMHQWVQSVSLRQIPEPMQVQYAA